MCTIVIGCFEGGFIRVDTKLWVHVIANSQTLLALIFGRPFPFCEVQTIQSVLGWCSTCRNRVGKVLPFPGGRMVRNVRIVVCILC